MSGSNDPTTSQYLNAANWAYYQSGTILPPGLTPLLDSSGKQVTSYIYNDGFYAAAFVDSATHQVVITYQGTNTDTSDGTYNFGYLVNQLVADVGLYLGQGAGHAPLQIGGLADATSFVGTVQAAIAGTANSGDQIVLTGHSLGASEAEYAAATLGLGGVCFAATGLSDTAVPAGTSSAMGIYADYGDVVGRYAVNYPDALGSFIYDPTIRHIGTTTLIPDTFSGMLRGYELAAAAALFTSGSTWSVQLAGAAALIGLLAQNHPTTNYAADLGITLVNNDPGTGIADQVSDPSLLVTILPALLRLERTAAVNVVGSTTGLGLGAAEGGHTNVAVFDGQLSGTAFTGPAGFQDVILAGSVDQQFTDTNNGGYTVFAGAGSDTILGGAAHEAVFGSIGNLYVAGGTGGLTYTGGTGSSTVYGGGGASTLVGGTGASLLVGSSHGGDELVAGSGSSTLVGTNNDSMFGGSGADVIYGSATGANVINTGPGPETIVGASGGSETIWATGNSTQVFAEDGTNAEMVLAGGQTTVVGGGGSSIIIGSSAIQDVVLGAGDGSVFAGGAPIEVSLFDGFSTGAMDVIGWNNTFDHLADSGYGAGAISQSVSNGNLTLALSGGGHVTFFGVTSVG